VPYDAFPTRDGYIIIAVIVDEFWKNLMQIVELPELDTEENLRQPGRWANRALINQRLSERLQTQSQAYWLEKLRAARIPCAPVNDFARALSNEQVLARGMVIEVEHPQGGCVKMPGNPVKLSEQTDTYSPPPLLGQHTEEVLCVLLGKTETEIAVLRSEGVI
jgi:crotonobetainyl-CoA:carnitine CoA-transferase CaiB-like acyl-CoA transferase